MIPFWQRESPVGTPIDNVIDVGSWQDAAGFVWHLLSDKDLR